MSTFFAATRAEFTKVFTTRIWWVLLLILVLYVALMAGGMGALLGATSKGVLPGGDDSGMAVPPGGDLARMIYSMAPSIGYVFPLLLGTLATTGEVRHQTLTPTFLATPRRGTVLGAKWLTMLLLGAGFGVAAFIGGIGAGAPALAVFDIGTGLGDSDTWLMVGRAVLAMALWAALGVGLGSAIPNQVAAIVVVLAFTQFVEPVIRSLGALADWIGNIAMWLPGAVSDSLVGASFYSSLGEGFDTADWWAGGLALLGYAVVVTIIGWLVTWGRDVT